MANRQLMIWRTERQLPRVTVSKLNGHIRVAGRLAWRCIAPGRVRDGPFIATIIWQPLSGGMMIGGEVGRMTKPLRRKPSAEIRWFDGVPGKGLSFPECNGDFGRL